MVDKSTPYPLFFLGIYNYTIDRQYLYIHKSRVGHQLPANSFSGQLQWEKQVTPDSDFCCMNTFTIALKFQLESSQYLSVAMQISIHIKID